MLFLIQYGMETGVNGDNGKNVPRFVEAEHRHAEGAVMTHPRTMGEITALGNPLRLKAAIQNAVSTFYQQLSSNEQCLCRLIYLQIITVVFSTLISC